MEGSLLVIIVKHARRALSLMCDPQNVFLLGQRVIVKVNGRMAKAWSKTAQSALVLGLEPKETGYQCFQDRDHAIRIAAAAVAALSHLSMA